MNFARYHLTGTAAQATLGRSPKLVQSLVSEAPERVEIPRRIKVRYFWCFQGQIGV